MNIKYLEQLVQDATINFNKTKQLHVVTYIQLIIVRNFVGEFLLRTVVYP